MRTDLPCSMIDGKLQLEYAPAAKNGDINKTKSLIM